MEVGFMTVTTVADGNWKKSAQGPGVQGFMARESPTHQGPSRVLFMAPQNQMFVQPSGFTVGMGERGLVGFLVGIGWGGEGRGAVGGFWGVLLLWRCRERKGGRGRGKGMGAGKGEWD